MSSGSDYLGMVRMADEQDVAALRIPLSDLGMNFCDQRANGIHDAQTTLIRLRFHGGCTSMRGQYRDCALRDFAHILDKNGA
ncbi:hypothetical protein AYR46_17945 [Sphingobium yanoikuyae]|nr:hypothetical protein AYR46_17945 [Sphingobium yanoikuyae]